MKRILGFILVSAMLLTMIVPVGAVAKTIPEVGEIVYSQDFSGDAIDATHISGIKADAEGSVTQESGKLHMVEGGASEAGTYAHRTAVNVYPYANNTTDVLTGKFVVEFTWEKANADWAAEAFLLGSESATDQLGDQIRIMSYKASNGFWVSYTSSTSPTAGGPNSYKYTSDQFNMSTNVIKVTMAVDTDSNTLDLWINDNFAETFTDVQISGLQRIQFDTYGHDERISDITVDDLRIYTPAAASASADLQADFEALTRASLLTAGSSDATLLDDLKLPTVGENGSTISWSSTDSAVINPATGAVTRPALTKSVNLTATLSDGASQMTKVFAFRVPGKEVSVGGTKTMPQKGTVIYETGFDGSAIDATHISASTNTAQNNAMYLTRNAGSGQEAFFVAYPKTNYEYPIFGKVVYEFYVDKITSNHTVSIRFDVLTLDSNASGLKVYDPKNESSAKTYGANDFGMDGRLMKVTAAFDTTTKTYDLWINNNFVQSGSINGTSLGRVIFSTGTDSSVPGSFVVDNFSAYYNETVATYYKDSFDGASLPSNVTNAAGATISGGALYIPSSWTQIDLNTNATNMQGKTRVDLTLSRGNYNNLNGTNHSVYLRDDNGNNIVQICWYSDGGSGFRVIYNGADGKETFTKIDKFSAYTVYTATATLEYDTTTGKVTVYAGGQTVVADPMTAASKIQGVGQIWFGDHKQNTSFKLLDLHCYNGNGSALTPETLTTVSSFDLDYNAFDKKLNLQTPSAGSATLIVASYNGNTLLSAVPVNAVSYTAGGSQNLSIGEQIHANATSVKVFMWSDATSSLMPVCEALPVGVVSAN